ncbi:S1C family serine protease [Deinococcus sp. HMF7604]|uniref:S1C family serine protease n=1 Tax=Deinococcus betulae TaxID=2873312 RepID=UPI001CCBF0B0|nr:trypsin-like peptidase domain-containing protein [Deinococcus betulae]MBZ9752313.1 S1C family serine protease [Deinococcus betulae]
MTTFSELSNGLAGAVEAAAPSVVSVRAARPVSGTVIAPGEVLTAAHLLHTDEVSVVDAQGQTFSAAVVGRDPGSDLALLRVAGLDAPALTATHETRVGELLLAVGRPPHGVQAALGFMERGPERGWLPAGAAPFRGVSGGALVDARGGLVGLLNAGVSRGELLAVPAERALKVAGLLGTTGRVPRGYLGLSTQPVHFPGEDQPEDLHGHPHRGRRGWGGPRGPWGHGPDREGRRGERGRLGLTVVQVAAGSPGEAAGLRVGDVLLALNGEPMRHPRELLSAVRERANDTLILRVLRAGQEQDVPVTVGER